MRQSLLAACVTVSFVQQPERPRPSMARPAIGSKLSDYGSRVLAANKPPQMRRARVALGNGEPLGKVL